MAGLWGVGEEKWVTNKSRQKGERHFLLKA
jgi:hypothetical protein